MVGRDVGCALPVRGAAIIVYACSDVLWTFQVKAVNPLGFAAFLCLHRERMSSLTRCNPGEPNFIGARMAVYPMHDDFVSTVLRAVGDTNPEGLFVAVDDLGTTVQGTPERVFAYAEELFVRAASMAEHVTAAMQFASGGEPVSESPAEKIGPVPLPDVDFPSRPTGPCIP